MEFLAAFFGLILSPAVWIPVVLILAFLTWQNNRKIAEISTPIDGTLLALEIPRTNDKSEMAAEQLFASLHGILRDSKELKETGGHQEHLSFEIASVNGQIRFYVWTPKNLRSFVEGQIYAQYPSVQIHEAEEDYVAHERHHNTVMTSEIELSDVQYLPIKTFQNFEVDPLAGITGTLAKLEDTGEELWVQILTRPINDSWQKDSDQWIKAVASGNEGVNFSFNLGWLKQVFQALWKAPETGESSTAATKEISPRNKVRIDEAQKKATKLGYQVKIRAAYLGKNRENARLQMQALLGTFKQFNSTNLNGMVAGNQSFEKESLNPYRKRLFADDGFILNIEELASIFHLPHTNVETPNIVWASTKTAEPPSKLPVITGNAVKDEQISAFGVTNFRGMNHQFGMYRYDRSRHIYIIGQTGAGKSGLLELFALSDIFHNQGYAIIDPHGDFAVNNMKFIPPHRVKDVVYFNPADTSNPIGFNPLEVINPNMKNNISSEVIGVLKRMFGDSWGPRLEYILRYTILALLDRPETTMLDITRMLTDKKFRKETLDHCKDVVVLQFWRQEFGQWGDKQVNEAIAPVLNKVGAFTANPIIRNIIGQPKSGFNIRQIMDEGKILIVNLSKGLIGEDNASILGSFLVTKIQLAAMSRSDIPDVRDRRPFYLYVDEFQNFATDSFATILSEARKYGLNLTVANQYISQMTETVRGAVFGNVGTMISFRVSAEDSEILAKQFAPNFDSADLLQMNNRNFVINMVINGEKSPAFSASTLNLPPVGVDNSAAIIESSRRNYSLPRKQVELMIDDAVKPPENLTSKKQRERLENDTKKAQPQIQAGNQDKLSSAKQVPALNPGPKEIMAQNSDRNSSKIPENRKTEDIAADKLSLIQKELKNQRNHTNSTDAKLALAQTTQTEQKPAQTEPNPPQVRSFTDPSGEVIIDLHGHQASRILQLEAEQNRAGQEVSVPLRKPIQTPPAGPKQAPAHNLTTKTTAPTDTTTALEQPKKKRRRRRRRKSNAQKPQGPDSPS